LLRKEDAVVRTMVVGRTDDGVSRMVVQRRIHSEDDKMTGVWGFYKIPLIYG
jgi:hypothetical protein